MKPKSFNIWKGVSGVLQVITIAAFGLILLYALSIYPRLLMAVVGSSLLFMLGMVFYSSGCQDK